jgi:hypothetical protein
MQTLRLSLEKSLFAAAFSLALVVRLFNLGAAPLSDFEASWALQALNIARYHGLANQVMIGSQPGYIFPTSLIFEIFGSSNFTARLWPALIGYFMVFAPYLLRRKVGRWAAIILAFGFALDPGLVTVSRLAGGPILAVSFSVLALALWARRRPILAGISTGMALLSGPSIYPGLIGLGFALLLLRLNYRYGRSTEKVSIEDVNASLFDKHNDDKSSPFERDFLLATALTILLAGTFFFRFPQGLASWLQSVSAYLNGWMVAGDSGATKLVAALIVFQPLALLFGILGIGRWLVMPKTIETKRQKIFHIALFWLLANFVIIVIYPSRQVSDLVWILTPLWLIAAYALEEAIPEQKPNIVTLFHATLLLVLTALFWLTLVSTRQLSGAGALSAIGIQIALLLGILALGVLTTILVALGWSVEISRYGLVMGAIVIGGGYLISVLWGASQLRSNQPSELWSPLPATGQADLMQKTLQDLSNWTTGLSGTIEIISVVDNPSLRWILRNFPNAHFSSALPKGDMPPIILTPVEQESPAWAATYRGQDFVWRTWPGWAGALPGDIIGWLTFRQAPVQNEKVILWARADQFPGGTLGTGDTETTPP